jgi:hypothetical protein
MVSGAIMKVQMSFQATPSRSGPAPLPNYGIYALYNTDGFNIDRNMVKSYYMGIYMSNANNTGSLRASVSNNMIWGQGYSTVYQIYSVTGNRIDFYHNTTYNTGANGYNLYVSGGSANNIVNNIFCKDNCHHLRHVPGNSRCSYKC